ncbi:MAG: GTP 3',8-cyclase MoaA [Coriobacteriales bacterium]|nr:GTP 3',8-cyclase MoaA [Coriobacteriales bacterium]
MAHDALGRRVDYLRISITDRCNMRCIYCMPPEGVEWKRPSEILSYEEIERFAAIAATQGIGRIRLTGGEPLVRAGVAGHIRRLHEIEGIEAIALTTNATLLPKMAEELREAGLSRVNISLDSLDPDEYARITRGGKLDDALAGIDAALEVGFDPVKVNVVVVRSLAQDLPGFARMTIDRPLHVRFIEFMPVGAPPTDEQHPSCSTTSWTREDVVPSDEVLAEISAWGDSHGYGSLIAAEPKSAPGGWGPARYYHFEGAKGTIGVISPLSRHFCNECSRLRLTADGKVRPCLFSELELDAREALRSGDDDEVRAIITQALHEKPEGHDEAAVTDRKMSQIGG